MRQAEYDSLTIHDSSQIFDKPIDNLKGLCRSRASFVKCQPIQSMKHCFDLIVPEQLLSECLCVH